MKLNVITPRNFINPLLSRKSADKTEFEAFKQHFEAYQQKLAEQLNSKQTETNIVTNVVKPFFDGLAYQAESLSQKGQSGIDLVILENTQPAVIVEAKKPNSVEMIKKDSANKKSLHEAVLYFMREQESGNKSIRHIVITDFHDWFVFDAKDFDRLFWQNSSVKKVFKEYIDPRYTGDRTKDFYDALEKVLEKQESSELKCAHFNVLQKHNEKELTAIYKLLSPDCLLKTFNPNDANSLNKAFYDELLYILGLEESKKDGKKVIGQAKNKQNGTLFENISNKLGQYQKPNDFESVIKLIIIWVNRILFLKLLESQIVKWSGASKFLDHHTLTQYDQLEALFFEVLAKPLSQRTIQEFKQVPYLNSSLFEIHADEKTGITIATLADDIEIDYYAKTVLLDGKTRKAGKVSTLPYLLAFLDAYDFANDSDEELTNHNKTLINASVLGLIFEKINGYKDGSFYTPSFITMYMARETIEKSVIQKFNQAKGWQCKTLLDLINKDYEITEANALINSIKVCDPAVGSGHFLVSALNELLRIKSELGVLVDEAGKRIKDYKLSIENDELIVMSDEGEQFEYKKGNDEKTRIQKTLFKEKQTLIENCLFGVDINPNSVNICRLRLWIELLKNAYYKPNGELDTLPNIDINIKCGNSLISRFGLTDEIKDKNIKNEIQEYKAKVTQYKNNEGSKQQVLQAIDAIKAKFQTSLKSGHQTTQKLNNALVEFVSKFGFDGLSSHQKLKAIDDLKLLGKQDSLFGDAVDQVEKNKQLKSVEGAWLAVEDIESGKIYQNAFEWRFEFPEVLNEQGEFVGFDVVIGNPPYVFARENFTNNEKDFYTSGYKLSTYQINLYVLFIERALTLIRQDAKFAFIIPNNWLTINSAKNVREFVIKYSNVEIVNFSVKVFEDANVDTAILILENSNKNLTTNLYEYQNNEFVFISHIPNKDIAKSKDALINFGALKGDKNSDLIAKVESGARLLGDISDVKAGLMAYEVGTGNPKQSEDMKNKRIYHSKTKTDDTYIKYLDGKNVSRYKLSWNGEYLKYGDNLAAPRKFNLFSTPRILVRQIPAQPPYSIHACYTNDTLLNDRNSMNVININANPLYVLALLNSKLMTYWFVHKFGKLQRGIFPQFKVNELAQFPIAITENQQPLSDKVTEIMRCKQEGKETTELEAEIDALVYDLYGLTQVEIEIVEGRAQSDA